MIPRASFPRDALAICAAALCLWLALHIADRVIFGLYVNGVL